MDTYTTYMHKKAVEYMYVIIVYPSNHRYNPKCMF